MGQANCCFPVRSPGQAEIEANLELEAKLEKQKTKVLLLGAGSSGKSTLLKQMAYLYKYENNYPLTEVLAYRRVVLLNILTILQTVCNTMKLQNKRCSKENEEALEVITGSKPSELERISPELISTMRQLWDDKSIKKAFDSREPSFNIDNAQYFVDELDRITDPNYEPTFEDIVKTRTQTTGVIEEEFVYKRPNQKQRRYLVVDVGGQRSERGKWINQFVDVFAVLWVFALSSYDQVLFEDATVNRMQEEFTLFRNTLKHPTFKDMDIIVMLNKLDQLQEKISRSPFTFSFEDNKFTGDKYSADDVVEYAQQTLTNISKEHRLYFHIIVAIDTGKFESVFRYCHEIMLRDHLNRIGVL